ncbi:MAG: peptidoglycan bridge formation glycyltransferase FemA/FemB family protein, partial [Ktedonobacteraceae bacterium]|nr:peptidoglycan bridge formation glycyltransferase FemA/FemB family protein [Ktedonobacteraceae bacterium]
MISRYHLCPVSTDQRQQWDAFVSNAPSSHLLQSWGWGELKARAGWSPLRLALWKEGEIVAAATVLRRTAPHLPLYAGHFAYIP